ncbi:metalloendopeptidase, partial [Sphingomonas paucimobilis]|nr:metalloendopeptidase [Sphingomonas paucimobilis]
MRRRLVGLSGLLLLGATDIAADQRRLAEARAGAATAQARARGLEQRAGAERDAAAAAEAK